MNIQPRRNGFTLIEMLVVLTVVAILASISVAVFLRVRESGRSTVCRSNLAQIALAIQQYVQDNNGYFPPNMYMEKKNTSSPRYVHWNDAIMSYVKEDEVFYCPTRKLLEAQRAPGITNLKGQFIARRKTSYDYNYSQVNNLSAYLHSLPTITQLKGVNESTVLFSTTTVLNFDRSLNKEVYEDGSRMLLDHIPQIISSCNMVEDDLPLHSDGNNYSFVDGHVKWMTASQLGETECASRGK